MVEMLQSTMIPEAPMFKPEVPPQANESQMREIPTRWKVNGQIFSSFNKTNVQVGQVSGTSGTVFQDANELL
ncbi:hypothetical protein REPUB_Repub09cG0132700 [Reevesia pubescens]